MKSQFTAFFGKLSLAAAFLLTLSTSKAQSAEHPANAATIKYLGAQDDMLYFDVAYTNPVNGRFELVIKDQDGTPLYQ
ncbi:MAG TPA: hypothetical protein VGE93_13280, partial [Bryobacteraceae bacterium]